MIFLLDDMTWHPPQEGKKHFLLKWKHLTTCLVYKVVSMKIVKALPLEGDLNQPGLGLDLRPVGRPEMTQIK